MTPQDQTAPPQMPAPRAAKANPEGEKLRDYPWFDWLRFVLASVVVFSHAGFTVLPFLSGGLAVSVFFALSGWLIGGILLRTTLPELPRFFFNRATRIWIPYGVAILLLYSAAAVREGVDFFWLKYLVLDVTFTHQLFTFFPEAAYEMPLDGSGNHFWSLSLEEQFYLLAPLVMLLLRLGKTLALWVVLSIASVALGLMAAPVVLGVCAAVLQRDHRIADSRLVRLAAVAVVVLSGVALAQGWPLSWRIGMPLFSVAMVLATAIPGRRSRVGMFLGGLSFPLYLNHWLGLALVHGTAKHAGFADLPALPLVSFLVAVLITVPLYWFVDRWVQKRRNGWYSPRLGRRLGATAYALVLSGLVAGTLMHLYGPHGVVPDDVRAAQQASH